MIKCCVGHGHVDWTGDGRANPLIGGGGLKGIRFGTKSWYHCGRSATWRGTIWGQHPEKGSPRLRGYHVALLEMQAAKRDMGGRLG